MTLDVPTMPTRAPQRRSSYLIPITPAHDMGALAMAMQRYIMHVELHDDVFRRPLKWYAETMDIGYQTFQGVLTGETRYPREEACRKIAAFFGAYVERGMKPPRATARIDDVDVLLEIAGHTDTYAHLVEEAKHITTTEIARTLNITLSPLWMRSKSPQKIAADQMLNGGAPMDQKVLTISALAQQWLQTDPSLTKEEQRAIRSDITVA